MDDFIKNSKVFLVGLKGTSKNSVRKFFTDKGVKGSHVDTSSNLEEALDKIMEDNFNIILIDDDSSDINKLEEILEIAMSKCPKKKQRIIILLANNSNQSIKDEFFEKNGDLHIPKPFNMDSFQKCLEAYWKDLNKKPKKEIIQKAEVFEEMIGEENSQSTKEIYKEFEEEILLNQEQYPEEFKNACLSFLESIEKDVKKDSLNNILNTGIESKNYKALNLFVKAWINLFPIDDNDVADVTRVLIYNKNFDLMSSISPEDQGAKIALGAGMVIAALVNQDKRLPELNSNIIDLIKKGLELTDYKNAVTLKSMEILINIGATDIANELFELPKVQENLKKDNDVLQEIQHMLTSSNA